jgi:uncharacterized protein (DUF2062 family)
MEGWLRRQMRNMYRRLRHPRVRKAGGVRAWVAMRVLDRELWRPDRHKMAAGLAAGLFVSVFPFIPQIIVGVLIAVWRRWNVPLAGLAGLFSNPVTFPITYLPAYGIGMWVLGLRPSERELEAMQSVEALVKKTHAWEHVVGYLIGGTIVGLFYALLGFTLVHVLWRQRPVHPRRKLAAAPEA